MSSTLTVTNLTATNLTDGSSTTSTFANVVDGSAKVWASMDASSGTPTLEDSLNTSSVTDHGTGLFDFNYTNNMGNSNYSISYYHNGNAASTTFGTPVIGLGITYSSLGGRVASKFGVATYDGGTSSFKDSKRNYCSVHGDLA